MAICPTIYKKCNKITTFVLFYLNSYKRESKTVCKQIVQGFVSSVVSRESTRQVSMTSLHLARLLLPVPPLWFCKNVQTFSQNFFSQHWSCTIKCWAKFTVTDDVEGITSPEVTLNFDFWFWLHLFPVFLVFSLWKYVAYEEWLMSTCCSSVNHRTFFF